MLMERPADRAPSLAAAVSDFGGLYFINALVAFVFAASGPVAIILAVGTQSGLSPSDLSSWIFGSFFVNGLISILFCWRYRQPLVFLWTIPGTVLVGPALAHLSFPEVIGAFVATGVLMLALGFSGWIRRAMQWLPLPIIMAMVAAFLVPSVAPRLTQAVPPLIGAVLFGGLMIVVLGRFHPAGTQGWGLVHPGLYLPVFSPHALLELVVPLAITVLVVQNGQGVAVLRTSGHEPPINAVTVACGAGSIVSAFAGTVSTCLTGPVNAIISASGEKRRAYTAGIFVGVLALAFGVASSVFVKLLLATPKAFIAVLAGLAMLRVLQTSFTTAFKERFVLGALVSFVVTIADVPIFSIGAPFWGLVFGFAVSWLLECGDFAASAKSSA